jgi:hypothetical protein
MRLIQHGQCHPFCCRLWHSVPDLDEPALERAIRNGTIVEVIDDEAP